MKGKPQPTYRFLCLFNTSFNVATVIVVIDEMIYLILAKNLHILFGVEFLGPSMPACRARHGHSGLPTSSRQAKGPAAPRHARTVGCSRRISAKVASKCSAGGHLTDSGIQMMIQLWFVVDFDERRNLHAMGGQREGRAAGGLQPE